MRTRMSGGVGAGRVILPATRLGSTVIGNVMRVLVMGSVTFIINGVKDTKNDKGKEKPNDNKSDNESGDSHDYLFIPRMASEPLNEFFHTHSITEDVKKG